MKKKLLQLGIPVVVAIAFVIWAWIRLVIQNSDLLYEAQDQNFWQPGDLFWSQTLEKGGSWVSWIGQYLTQYFYYPAIGASMLIALWLVIYALWCFAFRKFGLIACCSILLPVLLLFQVTSPGFHIYVSKVPDWWFTPTLMCLVFSLLLAICSCFMSRKAWIPALVILACNLGVLYNWAEDCQVPKGLRSFFHSDLQDTRFLAEMRMERAAEEGDWNKIMTDYRQCPDAPTRAMWVYKNLALFNQGRLLEDWLNYYPLTIKPSYNDSIHVAMAEGTGPSLYYHLGCIEYAYRWCVENMVEYGPSMKRLRLMTRCALVKHEWVLADKYINLLSRTTFHAQWANEQRKYLYHPELLDSVPEYRMPMLLSGSFVNLLDADNGRVENYLISSYTNNNFHQCPEHSDMSLMLAMQTQNIQRFWEMFGYWVRLHPNPQVPRSVQEAAYLFVKLEPHSAPSQNLPFAKEVIQEYEKFDARSQELMRMGYKDDKLSKALYREFGKTYYWFYFFCRNLSTY